MSINPSDMNDGARGGASQLLARGATDDVRADHRMSAAIDDFFMCDDARLDDRTRVALGNTLMSIITGVENELRQHAARLLIGRDDPVVANRIASESASVFGILRDAGLLRDRNLMRELLARVRQEILCEALPILAPDDPDIPSLLSRLVGHADGVVAAAATAMMAADARRAGAGVRSDLPAELHHRIVWLATAVLREQLGEDATPAADRALTEAALRSLSAHDEGERLEAAATRLALAMAPQLNELPTYLLESLGDRRVALFVALLAHKLSLSYEPVREIILDPLSDRLWLALRAAGLERPVIARIGLALCEADPRRSVEIFADGLDDIMAVEPMAARASLATLSLHPDFRQALMLLVKARHQ